MSSLFSYELDEKNIRSTLQKAEMPYNDSLWSDFDSSFSERPVKKTSSTPAFIKFNLNINRNILLPVFFIIALAGVSAIMFRFVDLKSGKNDQPEQKALIPNAGNYKIEKKIVAVPKKEIPKQIAPAVKKDSVIVAANTTPAIPTETIIQNQNIAKNIVSNTPQKSDTSTVKPNANLAVQSAPSNTVSGDKPHKKRRRNRTAEQIDAIQAPLNLSSNSTPEIEPELKIK